MRIFRLRPRPAFFSLPLALCLAGCHHASSPPPAINNLTDVLENSAEKSISPAPLANEQVILTTEPGQVEVEAAMVLKAATAAGGVGIRSVNDQGQVSIIATIPDNNAGAFKAALRDETLPMQSPSPSTSLIEVLIVPPTPSPTP